MNSEIEKLKLLEESRSSHEKFHWNWTFLSGGTLTLLIGFIERISPIDNPSLRLLARYSIIFMIAALVLSPIRNLLSALIVGKMASIESMSTRKEILSFFNDAKIVGFFVNVIALLSICLYILGLSIMSYVAISTFL
ncbi:MAG: hypothetical protein UW46_C0004G0058 [Candidatus Yanofskybacteria bacterium GW2011_GWF1_44_227]|uniref:Uncharacterized protein n=1 Tax=Candidatus Yanofskybacteria bacterium GW2011_GWE2_40_11 TaxID=1619033 RepID=A0A0G0QKF4_9BACT|nr:MAG: hypothetical protein UT75_C0007G0031 [Candidatus Yanofskybacteria bacterium GW2011_GWE2_40_11]KKT15620.1 MAG: hypothetical protein UV97_C0004G0036 [Candidatus Yanofskybacteria bacterium GW2011_GWF2_43_596]KKT53331.1 MAG: hypothetical protein UW46_C0004G0058 [Candidatus Yanofskybacteria bacterium GW2011_GWF1_44_227]OGN35960.1 MAG: hypothetical protein A2207_02780 [Candidatus Yanofskybacteria bacterium RIFOXYA1_FULL_44_17]OGN36438.1 MAG: hypothetical protein A2241_01705 [Candidatus Yanofs